MLSQHPPLPRTAAAEINMFVNNKGQYLEELPVKLTIMTLSVGSKCQSVLNIVLQVTTVIIIVYYDHATYNPPCGNKRLDVHGRVALRHSMHRILFKN